MLLDFLLMKMVILCWFWNFNTSERRPFRQIWYSLNMRKFAAAGRWTDVGTLHLWTVAVFSCCLPRCRISNPTLGWWKKSNFYTNTPYAIIGVWYRYYEKCFLWRIVSAGYGMVCRLKLTARRWRTFSWNHRGNRRPPRDRGLYKTMPINILPSHSDDTA